MKDLLDAIGARIKSPYFGYSVFAFIALNWRPLFILIVSTTSPQQRIADFDSQTNVLTLLVYPLLFGFIIALSTPWIRFAFEYISRKPFELSDSLKLEAQNKNLIKQAQLEQSRSEYLAVKESELIERAKRDEALSEISDEDAKAKLSKEIDQLRKLRDNLSSELNSNSKDPLSILVNLSNEATELLLEAAKTKDGTIMIRNTLGGRSIHSGGKTFGKESSQDFARYEEAIKQLTDSGLLKARGFKGEIFELTNQGWKVGQAL